MRRIIILCIYLLYTGIGLLRALQDREGGNGGVLKIHCYYNRKVWAATCGTRSTSYFLFKKKKCKNWGYLLIAFGMVFMGLQYMGAAFKPLRSMDGFITLMSYFSKVIESGFFTVNVLKKAPVLQSQGWSSRILL